MISRRMLRGGACAMLAASAQAGLAQQWPSRTVKVVVPYGVGGVTDTMARVTADRLGKALGQTFVIENKLGGGGGIGVDYAVNSPQDGYTHPVRRQHAVHRAADRAEGELRAAEGPRAGQHHRHQRHGDGGAEGRAVLDAARVHRLCAGEPRQDHLFERRPGDQQPSLDRLSGRQGKARHGARAVRRRPGRAARGAVEVGRHAFRQLVRPDRAGEERHGESARRIDAAAHAATARRADRCGNHRRASNTSPGTAMR